MELSQKLRAGDFILSLANRTRSLENGILAEGETCTAGTVLGQVMTVGAAAAVGTPTGNGTVSAGAIGSAARPGTYQLVCVAAAAGAGTFNFYAPDAGFIREVEVGAGSAPSVHIDLAIAAGEIDFAVNDTFLIEVTGSAYRALDPAGDDGSQVAAGILFAAANASAADVAIVVVRRDAEIKRDALTWPEDIVEPELAIALDELADRNIRMRPSIEGLL